MRGCPLRLVNHARGTNIDRSLRPPKSVITVTHPTERESRNHVTVNTRQTVTDTIVIGADQGSVRTKGNHDPSTITRGTVTITIVANLVIDLRVVRERGTEAHQVDIGVTHLRDDTVTVAIVAGTGVTLARDLQDTAHLQIIIEDDLRPNVPKNQLLLHPNQVKGLLVHGSCL